MNKTKQEWAIYLASQGFKLIRVRGKRAVDRFWDALATSDPETIAGWFADDADLNYGVVAGDEWFLLDIDNKSADGFKAAADVLGVEVKDLPNQTFAVNTPSGGMHLYFKSDKAYGNSASTIAKGLDSRSGNGYVVGPGSTLNLLNKEETETVELSYDAVSDDLTINPIPERLRIRLSERGTRAVDAQQSDFESGVDLEENVTKARAMLHKRKAAVEYQGGNHHTYATACLVRDHNVNFDKGLELMLEWNEFNEPPWDHDKLEEITRNAYNYANRKMGTKAGGMMSLDKDGSVFGVSELPEGLFDELEVSNPVEKKPAKPKFPIYNASEIYGVDLNYNYIIDKWLPDKNFTIVLGGRGSGKTTAIIDTVCHVANDMKWHGVDVDPGWYVVYIAGEDSAGVKDRYEAWCEKNKDYCRYNDEMEIYEINDPNRLLFVDMAINLMNESEVMEFSTIVKKKLHSMLPKDGAKPKVIFVIDTWQRMTAEAPGGQSDDVSMQLAVKNLTALANSLKGPCLISAHPPKSDHKTMAGSGIIENSSDAIWQIETLPGNIRKLSVPRTKGTPVGNYKTYQFLTIPISGVDRFGRQRESVVVHQMSGTVSSEIAKNPNLVQYDQDHKQQILSLLRDMLAKRQTYNPFDTRPPTMANITEMARELFMTKDEILAEAKFGDSDVGVRDERIREDWKARIKVIGLSEDELRTREKTYKDGKMLKKADLPFYRAMESVRVLTNGEGEIAASGNGIMWTKKGNTFVLSYGKVERKTIIDKMDEGVKSLEQIADEQAKAEVLTVDDNGDVRNSEGEIVNEFGEILNIETPMDERFE